MAEQFKIGETVRLKSGGPLMTITGLGNDTKGVAHAHTAWFDESKPATGYFPVDALERDDGGPLGVVIA